MRLLRKQLADHSAHSRRSGTAVRRVTHAALRLLGCVALAWATLLAGLAGSVLGEDRGPLAQLEVHPARIVLSDARTTPVIIASGRDAAGDWLDVTSRVAVRVENPAIVAFDEGILRPLAAGDTHLVVSVDELSQRLPVQVLEGFEDRRVSFEYEVLPALAKQSCSSGACHGSPNGKGGFRLSLRGFDPQLDRQTLLREEYGRRTNPFEPQLSLLLRKPTMRVPHGGGLQLTSDQPAHRVLVDWISQGTPVKEQQETPHCVGITLHPDERVLLGPGSTQQLTVDAHFSDGTVRNITQLAVFENSHNETAEVDRAGRVTARQRGETTVLAKYLHHVATSQITVLEVIPEFADAWMPTDERNLVDQHVFGKLKMLQVPSSPLSTDAEFLRRVYLDMIGVPPGTAEVTEFLANDDPKKRTKVIDRLLERPEYARFWAQKWADLLRIKNSKVGEAGVHKFNRWLVAAMEYNLPYDRFATELLTGSGSTFLNPPANYYRTATTVNDCAETTAQLFLGIRIGCARCHNHPFERWSQDQYYGLGSFFTGVMRKESSLRGDVIVYSRGADDAVQPRTGEAVGPWLPSTGHLVATDHTDRRRLLAEQLTTSEERLFARVGVNRIWGHVFGRGIVHPVDDFRVSNPPSHPELLEQLADEFIASGFDQKHVLRLILNSSTYQLSSAALPLNAHDNRYFSHYYARLLAAEQLLDAVDHVTGVRERFAGLPAGTRATQLPSPDVGSAFLKVFGQPGRNTACACERDPQPKLTHALQLISGEFLLNKLSDPESRLSQHLDDARGRAEAAGEPPSSRLALWLRADRGVLAADGTPAADGVPVASWRDVRQAETEGNAWQDSESNRPVYRARGIGRLPAVFFDGRDDFLRNESAQLVAPGAPRTVFIVAQRTEGSQGGALFTFQRSTDRSSDKSRAVFAVQHVQVGGAYYVYSDGVNGGGNTRLADSLDTVLGTEPFITGFQGQSGQKLAVTVNGNPLVLSQPGAVGVDQGPGGFTVGSREDIPISAQIWSGPIAEILVYEGLLSEQERGEVGSYLATRYAIASHYPTRQLPSSHAEQPDDDALLDQLYLAAFGRLPADQERAATHAFLTASENRQQGWEDIFWAVLNSKEFLFQH